MSGIPQLKNSPYLPTDTIKHQKQNCLNTSSLDPPNHTPTSLPKWTILHKKRMKTWFTHSIIYVTERSVWIIQAFVPYCASVAVLLFYTKVWMRRGLLHNCSFQTKNYTGLLHAKHYIKVMCPWNSC